MQILCSKGRKWEQFTGHRCLFTSTGHRQPLLCAAELLFFHMGYVFVFSEHAHAWYLKIVDICTESYSYFVSFNELFFDFSLE